MQELRESTIGVPWFDEWDWEAMQELNPGEFGVPYRQWYLDMKRRVSMLEHEGYRVAKLCVDARDFRQWCAERRLTTDNHGWYRYVVRLFDSKPL